MSLSGEYIRYLKKKAKKGYVESQCTVIYSLLNSKFNTCPTLLFLSKDFHPAFSRIAEIVPSVTPLMDCTATETRIYYSGGKCVNFEMSEVVTVKLSPNRSNIM